MKTVTLLAATLLVALAALVYTGTSLAAPATTSRSSCSDLGYLNAAIKGTNRAIMGWKAAQRDAYTTAITRFKEARYWASSSAVPCEYDLKQVRRYSIKRYDASLRYAQAARVDDWDEADYWMDEVEHLSDLIDIWSA